ncbi:Phosphate acetyltransferase [metagenome]|uniref:Phosphate acetyltransferase n=1 Tax=metagenome TaxID=256318 RepID=A0A2P2C8K5_9ZZZZ
MTRSVFVTSPEARTGKSAVGLGLFDLLARDVGSVGVFRPLVNGHQRDVLIDVLVSHPSSHQKYEEARGVTYEAALADPDEALAAIVHRFGEISERHDFVLIMGSDFTDVSSPTEHTFNARIAANLGSPVVMVVSGVDRTPDEIVRSAGGAIDEFRRHHNDVVALIANRVTEEAVEETQRVLESLPGLTVGVMPEHPLLTAPTVREQVVAAEATLVQGEDAWLDRESLGVLVAGMTLPNVLDRLFLDATVVTPSDRTELLAGLLMAHQSDTFPTLGGIILVGGYEIPPSIQRLCAGVDVELPIALTSLGTYPTAQKLYDLHGPLNVGSTRKIDTARRLFAERVDEVALLAAINTPSSGTRTPLMFEYQLMERARGDRRRIVLPEATDDRILEAADVVLRRGVADVTLLGEHDDIAARARTLGIDVSRAEVVSLDEPELAERFSAEYARLRSHKGVTLEQAREVMRDASYFGTMMVHLGLADGMVSGAINTTAHTIRPSLQFIRTKPGVTIVSSVFLMCLADRVLAYGDCAVNPDPTAEELADIAISSAETAAAFGIEPRVAMLSYSTGASGTGADVDKVRAATELVRERAPDLLLEGPIQYDAAIDPTVARAKLPGSAVAGRATVFVFPDLNTGNNTYKAVQRSAGAVAIGPILQGLNKPINDLSRGALVHDIVNTVVITAIQAQPRRGEGA